MLLAGACRSSDPYADYKPAQLLYEGERLLRIGDLAGAENALRLGLQRTEKNAALARSQPAFLSPLFHLAVKRGDGLEASKLLARMGTPLDVRAAHDMAVLTQRSGALDDAREQGDRIAQAMQARAAADDDVRAVHVAAWITIDRLRSARFDRPAAREASDAVIVAITDVAEIRGG